MQPLYPLAALLILALACAPVEPPPTDVEAISLLGDTLRRVPLSEELQLRYEANLDTARAQYARTDLTPQDSAEALIWLGRRTAYLGRYREAIDIFSEGVDRFPDDARFLRHRGHRYITVREFDRAITDLANAAHLVQGRPDQVEPDGLPNARNTPTSTLHSNIWYHLGLAHYLKGNFEQALGAYQQEAAIADNPDMLVATSWWRYLTLRRLGRRAEADSVLLPINDSLDVIENQSYHRLLLLAKGVLPIDSLQGSDGDAPADAAVRYGIAAWHLVEGRQERADSLFRELIDGDNWAAFGVIAAEAELSRPRAIARGLPSHPRPKGRGP